MVIREKTVEYADNKVSQFPKFLILFIMGFFTILVGFIILVIAAAVSGNSTNFGAIVFIGPVPIVIGVGPKATWIILFSIILAVLSIIIFLAYFNFTRKEK